MKRSALILLFICLLLTLTACGAPAAEAPETPAPSAAPKVTEAPAATEAPAPEATPEVTPEVTVAPVPEATASDLRITEASGFLTVLPMGETVIADLDRDGSVEKICISVQEGGDGMRRVKLKINDVDCTDHLFCEELVQLGDPDPDYYAITDLYDGDPSLEIAIQNLGPSDDFYTNFYRISDGRVYSIGGVPGLIWSDYGGGNISFDGKGSICTEMRLDVLQTWFAKATYVLNNAEILEPEPAELYEAVRPTDVAVLKDLSAYDGKNGEKFIVDAGVQMTVEATDNREWLYCKSYTSDWALWFRLNPDNPIEIETPDGFVPVWDALDGLCFAD